MKLIIESSIKLKHFSTDYIKSLPFILNIKLNNKFSLVFSTLVRSCIENNYDRIKLMDTIQSV